MMNYTFRIIQLDSELILVLRLNTQTALTQKHRHTRLVNKSVTQHSEINGQKKRKKKKKTELIHCYREPATVLALTSPDCISLNKNTPTHWN